MLVSIFKKRHSDDQRGQTELTYFVRHTHEFGEPIWLMIIQSGNANGESPMLSETRCLQTYIFGQDVDACQLSNRR